MEDMKLRTKEKEAKEIPQDTVSLEEAILEAEERQGLREGASADPDARYQSSAAQSFLRSQGEAFTSLFGITDKKDDSAKKLERIFHAIWEEKNPDAYLAGIQRFMLGLAKQVGIPGLYEKAIEKVMEDKGNTLHALEGFIAQVKGDNRLLTGSHVEILETIRAIKDERGACQERMAKAMGESEKQRLLYEHMVKESQLLEEDMDAARKGMKAALLEAQAVEAAKLEHDIGEAQGDLSRVKLEMEEVNLKLPYLDSKMAALYKSLDNVDADYIAHSEQVILLETARDILKESLRHTLEEDFGQVAERYVRSGKLIETIYQNLPSFHVRTRMLVEGKVRRPRFLQGESPSQGIHDRVRGLLDDISSLSVAFQSYQEK